ncbi:MAG: SufD family Fe-S cluster assembly protein [Erysipelotrichaceae bacterium]
MNKLININTNKLHTITLETINNDITINVDKHTHASLFIKYSINVEQVTIKLNLLDNAYLDVCFWNDSAANINIDHTINVYKDATLNAAYAEFSSSNANYNLKVNLLGKGSNVKTSSASLVGNSVHYDILCTHEEGHNICNNENYAVVLTNADFSIKDTGKIIKGASEAKSHQTTRVLTMSKNHKSTVEPLLLIDENDVEASHATSLGQIDENQLYYLQTRGLSTQQAMGLLTTGYLLPIAKTIQDEELQATLAKEIESKVASKCLI